MPPRNLAAILITMIVSLACYHKAARNQHASVIADTIRIIENEYVEPVEPRQLFEDAMHGLAGGLDAYSGFISAGDFAEFQESLDQRFAGVGILVEAEPKSKRLIVVSPVFDSPAFRAGVRAGDLILAIDGHDTESMPLSESVDLMRGHEGTSVRLGLRHAGEDKQVEYTIERAIIPVESVLGDSRRDDGSWNYFLASQPQIGYIRLTTFGELSADELRKALRFDRHPVEAVILDVRNNAGGLLRCAVDICDMFLEDGQIVSTRGRDGVERDSYHATEGVELSPDIPLVVLTNGLSASASEILAACLQDHGRAVVIGERTWGKGTVQNVIELEGGESALKLTTASYWRPSGRNIHRLESAEEEDEWGVRPDEGFLVPLTEEQFEQVTERRRNRDIVYAGDERPEARLTDDSDPAVDDPQLRRAVEYLRGQESGDQGSGVRSEE